ncbi:CbtA family protein [Natronomonas sp.]|uniref:CbtA family protein n=1 Tax=Natronomonas sp. TaxID=2184060 RepID=UPI0026072F5D|nr:CbtA family protein [Natronomonas sp.]
MIQQYFQRGVGAGAVAGLAYGAYMALVGNPLSEHVHEAGHGADHTHAGAAEHAHEAGPAVSEATTAAVSAGSGVLWGVLLGGVFAVAFYLFEPALPGRPETKAYVLAGVGFFSVSATPWLVFPPAAPGAEHLYGIEVRIAAYLGLVAVGLAVSAAAVAAYRRVGSERPGLGLVAAAAPVSAAALLLSTLAPQTVISPELPADLLAAYRGLTVLTQAGLWLVIAAAFSRLQRRGGTDRAERPRTGALSSPE